MCDPVSIGIATATLGTLSSISEYVGQNQAAKSNQEAANYNFAREREAIGKQGVQLDRENSEAAFDTAITTAGERGRIVASASESGLAPASISQQLNASMFGIGRNRTVEETNFTARRNSLADSRVDAAIKRDSQIASMPRASVASLVIGIGKSALSGANAQNAASKAGNS